MKAERKIKMFSDIRKKFKELESKREGALIGYLSLGDPDLNTSAELVSTIARYCDIIELGIPFSDPVADGKTIQGAIDRALKAGMNTDKAFDIVRKLRRNIKNPFVFMTYYNIVLQYGEQRFLKKCKEHGINGLIIVDLPVEEGKEFINLCRKHRIDFISIISPLTEKYRIKKIARLSSGFLYVVSLLGVTGAREKLSEFAIRKTKEVKQALSEINKPMPIAVGFGISKKEHVREVIKAGANGAVVGSAFIKVIERNLNNRKKMKEELEKLAKELKEGTRAT